MKENQRIYSLDALKFIGAIIVVFIHYQQLMDLKLEQGVNFYGGRFYWGFIVELFFMISGFFTIMSYKKKEYGFAKYIKHKIIRIYPMGVISTTIYIFFCYAYKYTFGEWWLDRSAELWKSFASILLIHQGTVIADISRAPNNPTWYLGVLMICYVVFYCSIWLGRKCHILPIYFQIAVIFIGIGIISYKLNLPCLNRFAARGYCSFFMGVVIHEIVTKYSAKILKIYSVIILLITSLAFIYDFENLVDNQLLIVIFIIYPPIIFLFLKSESVGKIFNHKFFGFLGKVSFEVYLWHCVYLMIFQFVAELLQFNVKPSFQQMLIFLFITEILSMIMYKFVEVPITKKLTNIAWEIRGGVQT